MKRLTAAILMPLLAVTHAAFGQPVDCATPAGSTAGGVAVGATANFATGEGFVTITVSNTLANPLGAGQLLNGLAFTLSEGETNGILGGNSANNRQIANNGAFADLGPSSTGWALATNVNGGLELCVLCTDLGGTGPHHLLIGPSDVSGIYSAANASIAGNKPHNPFDAGPATFVVYVPGVTSYSIVTNATFFFSTADGVAAYGYCQGSAPPPG